MRRRKHLPASKLMGLIIAIASVVILGYAMIMMAITKDLSPLSVLITGVFGVIGVYVGFYLLMAKAEHIEDKRSELKKEIKRLEALKVPEAEQENLNETIDSLHNIDTELEQIKDEELPTINI